MICPVHPAEAILRNTDWAGLEHAYGSAEDVPPVLLDLLSLDAEACGNALANLDGGLLHQGSIYSATAPAALFVAAVLDDPRVRFPCESALPWDDRERPLLAALLEWLGQVASSAAYDHGEDDEDVNACRTIRPDLHALVVPLLGDDDPDVRREALTTVSHLLAAPELVAHRPETARLLLESAVDGAPEVRAEVAVRLGGWGVRTFLDDDHPGVRACAALTAAYDDDPAALAEVVAALRDPAGVASLRPQPLDGEVRAALIAALLRRTTAFEDVAELAIGLVMTSNGFDSDDWGPFVVRAFPDGWPGTLSAAQERLTSMLLANDRCWNPFVGGRRWFQQAGLPVERAELRALYVRSGL
ncbi:hypothetical protein ACFWNN_22325 [Lentzea sp. NPDC058450]|uniref:hypothetical protein n=1 Tax=Lentzea sp. NPDC058450 TaxID=3346505 RepID=UPI00365449F8